MSCHLGSAYRKDLIGFVGAVNQTFTQCKEEWSNAMNITSDIASRRVDHIVNIGLVYNTEENQEITSSMKRLASQALTT